MKSFKTSFSLFTIIFFSISHSFLLNASTSISSDTISFKGGKVNTDKAATTGVYNVVSNGNIQITIKGGDGGGGSGEPGGEGATITAIYSVSSGDIIRYVVGSGSEGTDDGSAGGAGSTGLFINNDLIMVAGGGAGGDNSNNAIGLGGASSTNGLDGTGSDSGDGGSNGDGGEETDRNDGAGGGGGINSDGGDSDGDGGEEADMNPSNGLSIASGGDRGHSDATSGGDGFTGGGGAGEFYAGGGGGYSGGGGAGRNGSAGGGGSYLNTSISSYVSGTITAGTNGGGGAEDSDGDDGYVIITDLTDSDGDGVADFDDIDDDNDGLTDDQEFIINYNSTKESESGVSSDNEIFGAPDNKFAKFHSNGDYMVLDFGQVYPQGTKYSVTWKKKSGASGTAIPIIAESVNNNSFFLNPSNISANNYGVKTDVVISNTDFRYIYFTKQSNPSITDYEIDAVGILGDSDFDGDGLVNSLDIDSDNDGVLDNIEGQSNAAYIAPSGLDTDNDGLDDSYDSDNGGTPITLCNQDGADNPDYIDLDSDNDGQYDWIEAVDDDLNGDALNDLIARSLDFITNGGNSSFYDNSLDTDADGIPNWIEETVGGGKVNGKSNVTLNQQKSGAFIPSFLDLNTTFFHDSNKNGLIDLFDSDSFGSQPSLPDNDFDGIPNYRDPSTLTSLPITLLSFDAMKQLNSVKLEWVTTSEINNDFFTIERSTDGRNFEKVDIIKGAGNSSELKAYSLYDHQPAEGVNYYRLKQTDFNGDFTFSEMVAVTISKSTAIVQASTVYPNPTNGNQLFLELYTKESGQLDLLISSMSGRVVIQRTVILDGLPTNYEVELLRGLSLSPGTYIITYSLDDEVVGNKQFIVK